MIDGQPHHLMLPLFSKKDFSLLPHLLPTLQQVLVTSCTEPHLATDAHCACLALNPSHIDTTFQHSSVEMLGFPDFKMELFIPSLFGKGLLRPSIDFNHVRLLVCSLQFAAKWGMHLT